jgi:hypothetical protein
LIAPENACLRNKIAGLLTQPRQEIVPRNSETRIFSPPVNKRYNTYKEVVTSQNATNKNMGTHAASFGEEGTDLERFDTKK